jgi:CMP-N-acetylneuraminic acid synthetase
MENNIQKADRINIGVVPVKANSNRFPGKNIALHKGEPLFWHAIKPLQESGSVSRIFIPTNSEYVVDFLEKKNNKNITAIWRSHNLSIDEEPIFNVLKYVHYHIDIEYDKMVVIMANCPGHRASFINEALDLMKSTNSREFRSFDERGLENGLMIFDKRVVAHNPMMSTYMCFGLSKNATEIHYQEDLKNLP